MSIKIENVTLPSPAQMEAVIRGMRNPMNSWDNSDSFVTYIEDPETPSTSDFEFFLGSADETLMTKLAKAGEPHRKYMRMMPVYLDITAPLYWWKEADTYKVGTVANSCSTMHKIAAKEFTLEDFSHEHLLGPSDMIVPDERSDINSDLALSAINVDGDRCYFTPLGYINMTCDILNHYRDLYLQTYDKAYWWQMIQLLPSSYNQMRTVMLNYEVLANIYCYRKDHKLDEWREFCKWIETLPHSNLITGIDE